MFDYFKPLSTKDEKYKYMLWGILLKLDCVLNKESLEAIRKIIKVTL